MANGLLTPAEAQASMSRLYLELIVTHGTDTDGTGTPGVKASEHAPIRHRGIGRRRRSLAPQRHPQAPANPSGERKRHREPERPGRTGEHATTRTGTRGTSSGQTPTPAPDWRQGDAQRVPEVLGSVRKSRRDRDAIRGQGRDFRTVHIRRASRE